ncbi:membrane fusion protein, Cu(I)/Ag(I) efflux system [Desulfacinum hydrothermale DSM 13146]|uniref:Membrane fusion protein, Cu(I)/Ag(I) efflux system n=1 Tax=Desulfacinum hydrothermale DSM 13146 TaxID=1121390 RepID=A0A1W1XEF8_9BACT|nr:efflux RND transporter periplasmic adaptor subunit [Desulfacinum hydrothermale]SMC22316.1 membrane fusion protein, Cu(I)/Ag(I) efflux system [Desulfacinum hydrothermale DSM 13146]
MKRWAAGKFKGLGWKALAVTVMVVALMVWGGFGQRPQQGTDGAPAMVTPAHAQNDNGSEKKGQIWTCSMHPQIRLPNPGKCPICGMDLIPATQEGTATAGGKAPMRRLVLSETARRIAQVQLSPVERRPVEVTRRLVGKLSYDERRVAHITSWVSGRLDRLYVDFTGTVVEKGRPMVYLYSPELLAAQSELLHAVRAAKDLRRSNLRSLRSTAAQTIVSAKEKLRLWGLTDAQIQEILRRGTPSDHMTILAPMGGTVVRKEGFEGMYVKTGTRIYTIADLSSLWLKLDAYESDLPWIRVGNRVRFEVESYPGEEFAGTVSFIDPFLDEKTRTIKVRVDVPNPEGRLRPGMFVRAELHATLDGDRPPLVIPASAPLITGKRAVVYVAVPDEPGTYEGREVVLGPRADRYYVVRYGLREGERVVTRGNFKIDSAVQILAKPSMMTPEGGGGGGMHHHGGSEPAKAKAASRAGVMEVPALFRRQLMPVMQAYGAVREAVEARDWTAARSAYGDLKAALDRVDDGLLDGHPWMVWDELSMLLKNDVIVALDAKKEGERRDAFAGLEGHMGRLMAQFALDHQKMVEASKPLEVPETFRKQVAGVIDAYLEAHEALAADKTQEAQEAVNGIRTVLGRVDMALLQGDAHMKWMQVLEDTEKALALMEQSKEAATFRKGFAILSEAMAVLAKDFALGTHRPLYRIRCPMAFEGRGATWLQPDDQVRNPYYGPRMLGCGDVLEVIP